MLGHWTDDVENMLLKLRLNSLLRSKYHKQSYFRMNSMLKYFRIPMIIFSALISVFSMSEFYLKSYINCTLGLLISIISSIELFLQIQKRMEIDLHNSKAFSSLAIEITKIINLQRENRNIDGLKFLDDKMNEYNSLVDLSIVTDIKLHEVLLGINLINNLSNENELKLLANGNIQEYIQKEPARANLFQIGGLLQRYIIDHKSTIFGEPPSRTPSILSRSGSMKTETALGFIGSDVGKSQNGYTPAGITRRNSPQNVLENCVDIENNLQNTLVFESNKETSI